MMQHNVPLGIKWSMTWSSTVPDPNVTVWCCILLFLCTLGGGHRKSSQKPNEANKTGIGGGGGGGGVEGQAKWHLLLQMIILYTHTKSFLLFILSRV